MLQTAASAFVVSATFFSSLAAEDSPLSRLEKRSASARWSDAREQYLTEEEKASTPARIPLQTDASQTDAPDELLSDISAPDFDSQMENEGDFFSLPLPLFDSQPQATANPEFGVFDEHSLETATASPLIPEAIEQRPSPALNRTVPNPYAGREGKPEMSPESATELMPTRIIIPDRIRVAQTDVNPVPPNPEPSRKPVLRRITEIQPFHDYVPPVDSEPKIVVADNGQSRPEFLELPEYGDYERSISPTCFHWAASNLTHNPLYFEDVPLERYGHTYPYCVQPFVSVGKFGLQVIGLPYQIALDPVCSEQYALGYYRPGDCAPFLRYRIPFNERAAATAAGVYTGLFFLFP